MSVCARVCVRVCVCTYVCVHVCVCTWGILVVSCFSEASFQPPATLGPAKLSSL